MRRDNDTTLGLLGLCAVLTWAVGCVMDPGVATVQGRVSDDDGYQALSFGGEGTTSAATGVRVIEVGNGGTLEVLTTGEVTADGRYSVAVPAERERLLVEAIDDEGDVVASAILEHSGATGETVTCTPLTSESSLEAAMYLVMATRAGRVEDVNVVDLRARVTSRLAAAVRDKQRAGEDVAADVRVLAEAALAAQEAEVRSYAEAGVDVTQEELFALELAAAQALNEALHDGEASAAGAYEAFYAALADVVAELGLTADEGARAESSAGLTFRVIVSGRMDADGERTGELRESALLAAALLEARAYERATVAVLDAADASEELLREAEEAARELRADITMASSAEAAASAYQEFSARLVGGAGVEASLLGGYLGVDAATALVVESAVAACTKATVELDSTLRAASERALSVPGDVDVEALATDVVAAYAAHRDAVREAGAALTSAATAEPEAAVALLVLAETSFRLGG